MKNATMILVALFVTASVFAGHLESAHNTIPDQYIDFGRDGNSPLADSLIEVEAGPANGGLEFVHECSPRGRRCVFSASLPPESGMVARYYWDFGDGSTWDHQRPIARHGYRHASGSVTVILAVELAEGGSYMTSEVVELPF